MGFNIKSNIKKLFVSILIFSLLLTSLGGTVTAVAEEVSKTTDILLNSLSYDASYYSPGSAYTPGSAYNSDISKITVEPIRLLENKSGYYENGYFKYSPNESIKCLIEFYDGSRYSVYLGWGSNYTYVNGQYLHYNLSFDSNQSYNRWYVGNTYTATLSLSYTFSNYFGPSSNYYPQKTISTNVNVSIVGISHLEINNNTFKIIEGTSQKEENGVAKYYPYGLSYKLHLTDGSTLSTSIDNSGCVYVLGHKLPIYFNTNQSETNRWTVGNTYWGTVSIDNQAYSSIITEIIGIESFEIKPINIIENTGGYNRDWYYEYDPGSVDYSITYSDGEKINGSCYIITRKGGMCVSEEFNLYNDGKYYDTWSSGNARSGRLSFSSDQGYGEPWKAGNTYTGYVTLKTGDEITLKTAPVEITILDSKYESIEIIDSKPINANDYNYIDQNGNKRYSVPGFTYKVKFRNGGYSLGRYPEGFDNNPYNDYISVKESQYNSPWTVDGENKVTVKIGGVSTSFSAKIEKVSDYEYIEENGGLFITNCSLLEEDLVIPEMIDGKKVIGVMSLGRGFSETKSITIPDSVKFISEDAFYGFWSLDTLNIGSSVSNLTVEMVSNLWNLKAINISANNPLYTSVEGIVYNKKMDTLVLYPLAKGNIYIVPDSLLNIDVLSSSCYSDITPIYGENSAGFRTLDGITYTADMKKIISCDPNKTGNYNMPVSVEEIADGAFSNSKLTSVIVSKNVTKIVYSAFYCSEIESISLPQNIKSIERKAFEDCGNLKNIDLPEGLSSIGDDAFLFCGQLKKIEFPESLRSIGESAFCYSGLESITIPASLEKIGNGAFSSTRNLKNVTIENGVESISDNCFSQSSINKIVIPNSVTYLGSGAFGWSELSEIHLGSGLTEICESTFVYTNLSKVIIPENIEIIHDNAFGGCYKLEEVIFKGKLVDIGDSAFYGCPLKDINLSKNITKIGMYAFSENKAKSIVFPESVTEIAYGAFSNADNLIEIDLPENISSVGGHSFDNTPWYYMQENGLVYLDKVLYGIKGSVASVVELRHGTTVIADYAFENSEITSISLPDTLRTIGKYAFHDSKSLKEIYIPASVTFIAEHAFAGCSNLYITVDPNNKKYSSYNGVLFNKDGTELIYCPKGSWYYEYNNYHYERYTIPDWVKFVRNYAFEDNNVLRVTVTNDETLFDEYAFAHSYGEVWRDEVSLNNSRVVTFICNDDSNAYIYAKSRMFNIEELPLIASGYCGDNIEWKLNSSGNLYITGTGEMYNYKLPTMTPWYEYAYRVREIIISENVTKIGNNSFNCFYNLDTVRIKNSNIQFGWYVFDEETSAVIKSDGNSLVEDYANKNGITFIDINKPDAPKIANLTQTVIELEYDSKYEYSLDGINWQNSNVFTNFAKNTVINLYQRVIGGHLISEATKCMVVSAPEVLVGFSTIHITKIEGFEYALDDGLWQSNNEFDKYIVPGETYTVYQRPINSNNITVLHDEKGTTVVVNGNEKIENYNATHLVWLRKILLTETNIINLSADINNDGKVDICDLVRLKKILVENG